MAADAAWVGRAVETARVEELVARARGGRRAVLVVDGEPGIGKSRLVSEAVARFRQPDDLVLVGHCVELSGGELPYGLVSDCLRSLVREVGVETAKSFAGAGVGTLASLCPSLGEGASVLDRAALLYAFVSLVERLAADRLVWLVVEDLQWSDSSSLELLDFLVRVTGSTRLAVLMTSRPSVGSTPTGMSTFVSELVCIPDVERLPLAPLAPSEVDEQIRALTHQAASALLVERIIALSQGVPFLVEQLVAAGVGDVGPVPASAWEPMLGRVDCLDAETRLLIQMASLAEGQVTHQRLEKAYTAATGKPDEFDAAVTTAVRSRVLVFDADRLTYTFVHALLRQAVDASVLPVDRLRWHQTWARVLVQHPDHASDAQLSVAIAHHWSRGGADVEAFDSAITAATHCGRLGAMAEMATMLRRALDLWDRVPAPATRAGRSRDSLLFDALNALDLADDATGVALLEAELSRSDAGDDPLRNLSLQLEYELRSTNPGNRDPALWQRAVASVEPLMAAEPSRWVVEALVNMVAHFSIHDPDRALELANRASDLAAQLGDLRLREMASSTLSFELAYRGRFDEAVAECARVFEEHPGREAELLDLSQAWVMWLMYAGRYPEAIAGAERLRSRLGHSRIARGAWGFATWILAEALLAVGRWAEAGELMETWAANPPAWHDRVVYVAEHVGTFACQRGDLPTAREWLERASWNSPDEEESAWLLARAEYRHLQAEIELADGHPEAARDALAVLWDHPEVVRAPDVFDHLILAAQAESDLADLRAHASDAAANSATESIRSIAAQVPRLTDLAATLAGHLGAELAHATGEDNPGTWIDVVKRWREVGHVPYLIQSLVKLGAAYLHVEEREDAEATLTEALAAASDLGHEQLRTKIIKQAQRHRLRLNGGSLRAGPHGEGRLSALTAREAEVLQLVMQGMSDHEIATALFISHKTVSVHVSNILAKLGVNSRAKAVAIAYEEETLRVHH